MNLSSLLMAGDYGGFGWILVIFGLYFLPTFVGWNKSNFAAIQMLNLLLGWTIIGWIVALVWALTNDPKPIVLQQQAGCAPPLLCANCGKYSAAGSRFCASCGNSLAAGPSSGRGA